MMMSFRQGMNADMKKRAVSTASGAMYRGPLPVAAPLPPRAAAAARRARPRGSAAFFPPGYVEISPPAPRPDPIRSDPIRSDPLPRLGAERSPQKHSEFCGVGDGCVDGSDYGR